MPGAGKSYWAEQIAAVYPMQCIDLDDMIRVRTGVTVSAFFERYGEASFRQLEQLTLRQVTEVFPRDTVIACGGGTPCFHDNLQRMQQNGLVIYLEAGTGLLAERLQQDHGHRPLLARPDWRTHLDTLLAERFACYTKADVVLSAQSLSIADFAPYIQPALL